MAKNSAKNDTKKADKEAKAVKDAAKDTKAKAKDAKAKDKAKQAKKKQKAKPGELTRTQKIVIVVFIFIFAFSTLASALSSVFSSQTSTTSSTETASDSTDDDTSAIDAIDEKYESFLASFEEKVSADASDAASVLALARYTTQWAAAVGDEASTDDETSHANELYEKAIAYYDQYLELEDSNAARVDQAMCKYYEGDTTAAVSSLESIVESDPDYALAWADLGMLYEIQSSTDNAKNAYQNAVAKDPDDEYGAKSYAETRLSSIAESETSSSTSSTSSSSSSSSTSLSDTLSSLSDTGL